MEELEDFFMGASAAFVLGMRQMQGPFIFAVGEAYYRPLLDNNFREKCKEVPAYGLHVFRDFADTLLEGIEEAAFDGPNYPNYGFSGEGLTDLVDNLTWRSR